MKEAEKRWLYKGLDCMVILHPRLGHRCGYVGVPKGHPWHGLDYTDRVPDPKPLPQDAATTDYGMAGMLALLTDKVVERVDRVELQVRVHGGVTFAGTFEGYADPGLWWFGFDTAHLDDTPAMWPLERVVAETERMADQIPRAMTTTPWKEPPSD